MVKKFFYVTFSLFLLLGTLVFYSLQHLQSLTQQFLQQANIQVKNLSWQVFPYIGVQANDITFNNIAINTARIKLHWLSLVKQHRDLSVELQHIQLNDLVLPKIDMHLGALTFNELMPLKIKFDITKPLFISNQISALLNVDVKQRLIWISNIISQHAFNDFRITTKNRGRLNFNWQDNKIFTKDFIMETNIGNTYINNFFVNLNTLQYQGTAKIIANTVEFAKFNAHQVRAKVQFDNQTVETNVLMNTLNFANLDLLNIQTALNYDGKYLKITDFFANLNSGTIVANVDSNFYHINLHAQLTNIELSKVFNALHVPITLTGIGDLEVGAHSFGRSVSGFLDHLELQAKLKSHLGYLPTVSLPIQINQQLRQLHQAAILSERSFYNSLDANLLVQNGKLNITANIDTPELSITANTQQNMENPHYTFNVNAKIKNKILDEMNGYQLALKNNFVATIVI